MFELGPGCCYASDFSEGILVNVYHRGMFLMDEKDEKFSEKEAAARRDVINPTIIATDPVRRRGCNDLQ
jgi:Leu/Phe-tRNA-protein transferase